MYRCSYRLEEGARYPDDEVIGGCKVPSVGRILGLALKRKRHLLNPKFLKFLIQGCLPPSKTASHIALAD